MNPSPLMAGWPSARVWLVPVLAGLTLHTFFQFPGHTWLQQDTQIYVPILEHLRDPAVLRRDLVAEHPHVAFTLYDETARALRRLGQPIAFGSHSIGFREVLEAGQLVTRALGIWGLFLLAESLGFSAAASLVIAAFCSLGAVVPGPTVLTFEYEPTPRAFAIPLLFCAIGLAARRRWMGAAVAAAVAFLFHPPAAIPFWLLFVPLLIFHRRRRELAVPALAFAVLLFSAHLQDGGHTDLFARITPLMEQLQRYRTSYVWISTWPAGIIIQHAVLFILCIAAIARITFTREQPSKPIKDSAAPWWQRLFDSPAPVFLLGLPLLGLLSMPFSWLMLERLKWSLMAQLQPMRGLLFVTLAAQFLSAAAALRARTRLEAWIWFALAILPPVQPLLNANWSIRALAVVLALAGVCSLLPSFRLPAALAAFFLIPLAGGVVNYPRLRTPELAQLSAWARSSTPQDSVFLFPASPRGLDPGIFRSEALRAVYVDWKGGGQVNYLNEFAAEWWFRWQQTLAHRFRPADMSRCQKLGIQYVVLPRQIRVQFAPVFVNSTYAAYRLPE